MHTGPFNKGERIILRHNQFGASPPLSQGFSQGKCHAALIASRGQGGTVLIMLSAFLVLKPC
jgi:hypothetical protein